MTKVWNHPIKAIIFDNDGTLMDTEWAYSWAHEQITGEKLTWDMKPLLMGKSTLETCQFLVERYHLDTTPEKLVEHRTKIVEQCWPKVQLLPGAEDLVNKLWEKKIPMSIATSSRRMVFNQKAQSHQDFVGKMHHIICGSDVTHGKPHPEIFIVALEKFENVKPEEALVFEDSPLGVKAANSAGIPCVFVPDENMDAEAMLADQEAKALITIKSLKDFDFSQFEWATE